MRTLLIAPSFLATFAAALFTVTWLMTSGLETAALRDTANPPVWAFTSWTENYPAGKAMTPAQNPALHEKVEELGL